jgi:uncharacterized protein
MRITFSEGHLSRVVMIRVLPGSDIIEGIEDVCKRLDIKTGVITCCIGSLQRVSLLIAVPLENKIGAGYSNPIDFDGPLEFLAGQGTIGQEEEGDLFIHMHGVLSDKDGNVHGGHLIKGKNPVLVTCEIMISHVEDVRMIRTYDPEIEMKVLAPSENGP